MKPSRAIVIGGSLAGLLTGRALVNHFAQVTIIERDVYSTEPGHRPGLPQSRFPHVLLMRGLIGFEKFFPGLRAELLERGAIELDAGRDMAYLGSAGWTIRCETDMKTLAFSRELLDWIIRRRLSAYANLQILEGARVTELLANSDQTCITGVTLVL